VTDSSLRTGQEDGGQGEVTSSEITSSAARRGARAARGAAHAQMAAAHLEAIAEELPAAAERPKQPPTNASRQTQASLVSTLAEAMLAALQAGRGGDAAAGGSGAGAPSGEEGGSGSDSESESESEGEDGLPEGPRSDAAVPRNLLWRPDLRLPAADEGPQERRRGAAARQPSGLPAGGGLSKLQRVPAPDKRAAAPSAKGAAWFELPATPITDEVKADLRILRLRSAFDPKSFYKKDDSSKFPSRFQMGTVVESAADFYSGRLTNKQRKRTLTEEVMADPHLRAVRQRRFARMQEESARWAGRGKGRKTDALRATKKPRRPKH
jgi:hypothetical protein